MITEFSNHTFVQICVKMLHITLNVYFDTFFVILQHKICRHL